MYAIRSYYEAVRALLASSLPVHSLLLTESWLSMLRPELDAARFDETMVFVATDALMEGIVGFSLHKSP